MTTLPETPFLILETKRLILRRLQADDTPFLADLWSDPDVTRFMGGPRDRDWLCTEFGISARDPMAERFDLWPVIEKSSRRLVGHCGLLEKQVDGRDEIELVYVFMRAAWGRGYASEMAGAIGRWAFESLCVPRLIALIDPANAASERVAVHAGFRLEKEIIRPEGHPRKLYALERS